MRNNPFITKIVLLGAFCISSVIAWAVPASPEVFTIKQSDGSELRVRLIGDEYASHLLTEDGYAIKETDRGYCYLRFTEQGKEQVTTMLAHNQAVRPSKEVSFVNTLKKGVVESTEKQNIRRVAQQRQATSSYPLTGSPKSLTILVNFSDVKFTIANPQEAYSRLLNEKGYSDNGGIGSAKDYFEACSNGAFSPQFDVYGPYDLDETCEYYGANSGNSSNVHAREMIIQACTKAYEAGVDLSQYDTDNNGTVDNVFVYYAGHNEAEGGGDNTVWPHRSMISNSPKYGDVRIYDYACTSELRGSRGSQMCGIGTFCHEFGHVLGLPDTYDTDNSYHYTVGDWSIMCSGSYNGNGKTPPAYTAYERFMLGWLTPVQLTEAGRYTLAPLNTDNTAYLICSGTHNLSGSNPSPNEFLLLENRQFVGWDSYSTSLAGSGMLIWHIIYNASAWSNNTLNNDTQLRYYIEAAHGGTQTASLASDPFPGTKNVTQFSPKLVDGTILSPLLDIQELGTDISFVYKNDGVQKFLFYPNTLNEFVSYYDNSTRKSMPDLQQVVLQGMSLDPETAVSVTSKDGFQLSIDSTKWSTTLSLSVNTDSTLDQTLLIRYNPQAMKCNTITSSITVRQNNNMEILSVSGSSQRPTYIAKPLFTDFTNVTPYTAIVNWEPQTDAEAYYLTVYELEDKESTTTQSFEEFSSEVDIIAEGWSSNFARVTSTAHSDGTYALWFKESDEQVETPTYVQPVTSLSFWYNALTSTDESVGVLTLNAYNGSEWQDIDEIEISRTTRKQTYRATFADTTNYVAFQLKYEALGGNGVAVDAFSATCSKEAVYLYKGRECVIESMDIEGVDPSLYTCYYLKDLTPDRDYYCQIQCSEAKGCEEHLTAISSPVILHTLSGEEADSRILTIAIDSIHYVSPTHVVYVPIANSSKEIGIYDLQGHLVYSKQLTTQENIVELPSERFIPGNVYIIKYHAVDAMKRKDKAVKIVF